MKKLLFVAVLGFVLAGCATRPLSPVHAVGGGHLQTRTEGETMEAARSQANYTAHHTCKSEKKRHLIVKISERDTRLLGADNIGKTASALLNQNAGVQAMNKAASDKTPFKVELTFKCQ